MIAAVAAILAAACLGLAMLRGVRILAGPPAASTAPVKHNPHNLAARLALAGTPCDRCVAGIRADGADCASCDATGLTLHPRTYAGGIHDTGGADVLGPFAPSALIEAATA